MKDINGLTLVELLISLALLAIISVAGISFFLLPNRVFDNIIVYNALEYDINDVKREMAGYVRFASKPDSSTNAIVIYNSDDVIASSGTRIDIYINNGAQFSKVSYKYHEGSLYRGIVEKATAEEIITTNVEDYSEVLTGVVYPSDGDLFQDVTKDSEKNGRRTILINLIVKDEKGKFTTSENKPLIVTSRAIVSP